MLICFFFLLPKMIIQPGIMTCAQKIYINNDNIHYHSLITSEGCVENYFLDLAIWVKVRIQIFFVCISVGVYGFQGRIITKVTISFYWLRSNKCIWQHYQIARGWPDTPGLCLKLLHGIKSAGNTCKDVSY